MQKQTLERSSFPEHKPSPEGRSGGPETQVFVYDGAGEVRNRLLSAPKWLEGEVMVPNNTITVSLEIEDINATTPLELSNNVNQFQEHGAFSGLSFREGYRKAGLFTTISSLNRMATPIFSKHERRLGERPLTATFLYDGDLLPSQGKETVVLPSALVVNGELSQDQLKGLREQFPTVPFVNAKKRVT